MVFDSKLLCAIVVFTIVVGYLDRVTAGAVYLLVIGLILAYRCLLLNAYTPTTTKRKESHCPQVPRHDLPDSKINPGLRSNNRMGSSGRSWKYGYNDDKNLYHPYKNGYNNYQNHNYHYGYHPQYNLTQYTPTYYVEPTYVEPTYVEPTYVEPTYVEPTYIEPSYVEPTYVEPTYVEPTYVEPTYGEPTYGEPTYVEPTYVEPTYVEPTYYNHNNYNCDYNYNGNYNKYYKNHNVYYEEYYDEEDDYDDEYCDDNEDDEYYDEYDEYYDEYDEYYDEYDEYYDEYDEYYDEYDEYYDYNNHYNNDQYYGNPYNNKNNNARNGKAVKQANSKNKTALVPSYPANYRSPYSGRIWDEAEVLAISERISVAVAQTFIKLLNEGCTLPFIARYRKDSVNYLRPDRLHELHDSYQRIVHLKNKVTTVLDTLKKSSKLTQEVETSILNARTQADLDLVYAPLKTQAISLVEKAQKLGLQTHANQALKGETIDLKSLCTSNEERSTVGKVEAHITHLIADIIHKDTRVLKQIKKLKYETEFTIQSKLNEDSLKKKEKNEKTKYNTKTDPETYQIYFNWSCKSHLVKPYQTLALNRGADENILAVQVIVPNIFYNELERLCLTLWSGNLWVRKGLKDAYNRFILSWLIRQVRCDLTNKARKEAVKTFTANLETYLLTEPVKHMRIAGIDPGFKHGCKVGVIETNGEKLTARAIFPDLNNYHEHDKAATKLKDMLHKYHVTLIGLGNGTACRETEKWLKDHEINIPVIIVPEQGASIYSISKEAQNWVKGGPHGARFNHSKSGWFDADLFEDWFESIIVPWAKDIG